MRSDAGDRGRPAAQLRGPVSRTQAGRDPAWTRLLPTRLVQSCRSPSRNLEVDLRASDREDRRRPEAKQRRQRGPVIASESIDAAPLAASPMAKIQRGACERGQDQRWDRGPVHALIENLILTLAREAAHRYFTNLDGIGDRD